MNYYKQSYHQCRMSSSSIHEFWNKHMYSKEELISLCIEGIQKFNYLSCLIKKYNGVKHLGISKNSFFEVKNQFVYFLYTTATPIDSVNHIFTVHLIGKYKNKNNNYPIYELEFRIDDKRYRITATDNLKVSYRYLEEAFSSVSFKERNENYIETFTDITSDDIQNVWDDLRAWCGEHHWFFTMYYDEMPLFDMFKHVYKDYEYALTYSPKCPSYKMMFRRPDITVYHIDEDRQITYKEYSNFYIRDIFNKDALKEFTPINFETDNSYNKIYQGLKRYYIAEQAPYTGVTSDNYESAIYSEMPYVLQHAKCIMHLLNYKAKKEGNKRFYLAIEK